MRNRLKIPKGLSKEALKQVIELTNRFNYLESELENIKLMEKRING